MNKLFEEIYQRDQSKEINELHLTEGLLTGLAGGFKCLSLIKKMMDEGDSDSEILSYFRKEAMRRGEDIFKAEQTVKGILEKLRK